MAFPRNHGNGSRDHASGILDIGIAAGRHRPSLMPPSPEFRWIMAARLADQSFVLFFQAHCTKGNPQGFCSRNNACA